MLKATAGKILPTTIIGSLPRPSWYTENLGTKSFVDAMTNNRFREQYTDALAVLPARSGSTRDWTSLPTATAVSIRTSAVRPGRAIRRVT